MRTCSSLRLAEKLVTAEITRQLYTRSVACAHQYSGDKIVFIHPVSHRQDRSENAINDSTKRITRVYASLRTRH